MRSPIMEVEAGSARRPPMCVRPADDADDGAIATHEALYCGSNIEPPSRSIDEASVNAISRTECEIWISLPGKEIRQVRTTWHVAVWIKCLATLLVLSIFLFAAGTRLGWFQDVFKTINSAVSGWQKVPPQTRP